MVNCIDFRDASMLCSHCPWNRSSIITLGVYLGKAPMSCVKHLEYMYLSSMSSWSEPILSFGVLCEKILGLIQLYRILENLPSWHRTNFRTLSDIFSTPIFITHFDKTNFVLSWCKVWDKQLFSTRRYSCLYISPGRCAQKVGFPRSTH